MEKVWANKLSNQKGIDMIPYFLFGVGVPNPDESGCCPAKDKDCSKAYRERLAKRLILKKWRPQPDLNRCCRRERPMSWTWLDDGDTKEWAVGGSNSRPTD